jgi:hypothetical protein
MSRDQFSFKSNPQFIFHDSPGFEAGGEQELHDVLSFIHKRAKAKEVKDQIHAIWCVYHTFTYGALATNNVSGFVLLQMYLAHYWNWNRVLQ